MRRLASTMAGIAMAAIATSAAAQSAPEGAVKAAFLLKLGAFATRGGQSLPRSVCAVGRDEVVDSLPVRGGEVEVRRLDSAAGASGCGLVYLASGRTRDKALADARGRGYLTVTDGSGGVVGFVVRDQRVRLTIDLVEARQRGLEVSSKLLSLALSVRR